VRCQTRYLQRCLPIYIIVLPSARTRLIFTRIQEGNPGRDTAGRADPTWPNRAGHSIPCAVMLGSGGGGQCNRDSLAARERERRSCLGERLSGSCGLCRVFSLCVSLLFLFPLFAVLLNCPYPDPAVFCLFLSILLHTVVGGGVAAWRFCCRLQPNQNIKFGAQAWGRHNSRAE